jgi:hypothetical protein
MGLPRPPSMPLTSPYTRKRPQRTKTVPTSACGNQSKNSDIVFPRCSLDRVAGEPCGSPASSDRCVQISPHTSQAFPFVRRGTQLASFQNYRSEDDNPRATSFNSTSVGSHLRLHLPCPERLALLAVAASARALATGECFTEVSVVPQASHAVFTNRARWGSRLLTEQQVTSRCIRVTKRYRSFRCDESRQRRVRPRTGEGARTRARYARSTPPFSTNTALHS